MIPRGGWRPPSIRGRGRGRAIIQHGRGQLFNARINQGEIESSSSQFANQFPLLEGNEKLFQEFMQFVQQKPGEIKAPYKNAVIPEEDNETSSDYFIKTPYTDTILILEYQDILNYHFDLKETPWELMSRYLEPNFHTALAYKSRNYFEKLLIDTSTCEIKHTTKEDHKSTQKFHIYSKIHIKKILSIEDWGISPFREKQFFIPENNTKINYNYWDYVEALHKVFFYQNPNFKHSWFIKVASSVYNPRLPNWFFNWWKSYGPSVQILMEPFDKFYLEWVNTCPKLYEEKRANEVQQIIPSLIFFTEFSIPWIWRWEPEIEYGDKELPKLKRAYYTKFWINMLRTDKETGELASKDTIDFIQTSLLKYKEQKNLKNKEKMKELEPINPMEIMKAKLIAQGIENPTRQQIMAEYLEQVQQDLIQYQNLQEKSDTSMKDQSDEENRFQCLAGESQEPEDEDMELTVPELFTELKFKIFKSEASSSKSSEDKKEKAGKEE